jgi:hypothetical protein
MVSCNFSETENIIVNTVNTVAKKRSRYTSRDVLKKMRLSTNETGPPILTCIKFIISRLFQKMKSNTLLENLIPWNLSVNNIHFHELTTMRLIQ